MEKRHINWISLSFKSLLILKIIKYAFIIQWVWEEGEKNYLERLKMYPANINKTKIQSERMVIIFINNFYQPMLLI